MYKCLLAAPLMMLSMLPASRYEPVDNKEDPPPTPPRVGNQDVLRAPKGTASNKVPGLELPADSEVSSKQRAVVIEATTKGQIVRWLVFNSVPTAPVSYLESPLAKSVIVFPNDQKDVIIVIAYTSIENVPTEPARTLISVKKGDPDPDPRPPDPRPPDPKPPDNKPQPLPPGTKLHVTMVFDHKQMTPQWAALENSKTLRDTLKSQGHVLHTLDVKQKALDDAELRPTVTKYGPFCLIIQRDDSGVILHGGPLPPDDKGVLDQVNKVMAGK